MHRATEVIARLQNHINTIATILLSVAALATSWAGYQSTLWSGDQNELANEAMDRRSKAIEAATRSGQLKMIDVGVFTSWLSASSRRDSALAQFLSQRFRPEFKAAFDKWISTNPLSSADAPRTPFVMPDYRVSADTVAAQLQHAADSLSSASSRANRMSDTYVLVAVILAMVMFFATSAQQGGKPTPRLVLIGMAAAVCLMGLLRLLTLPVA
ncbi:MAG TPA: hypothetical protein VIP11_23310 [Gemmatimonadaceae bacterium]